MRIGHFAQPLCQNEKTGIGWYTYKLIQQLATLSVAGEVYAFDLLNRHHSKDKLDSLFSTLNNTNVISCKTNPFTHHGLYTRLDQLYSKIPFNVLFNTNVEIYHAHNYFLPYKLNKPSVVSIYDSVYKLFPNTMDGKNLALLNRIMPRSLTDSTKILTISKNSKHELINLLNVEPSKISIAYPGIDETIYYTIPKNITKSTLEHLNIKRPFLLYVGTLEPRKNIERIIEAYAAIGCYHKEYDLVLAGSIGWKSEEIFNKIKKYSLSNKIHITGYISQQEQVALYNAATCFLFPSLYEGFGMPPLEAMACGCPVITSNTSSLPEVVGDAGILINPLSTDELAVAISKVLDDEKVQNLMKERNKEQVKKFSWHNTAVSVLELYQTMV